MTQPLKKPQEFIYIFEEFLESINVDLSDVKAIHIIDFVINNYKIELQRDIIKQLQSHYNVVGGLNLYEFKRFLAEHGHTEDDVTVELIELYAQKEYGISLYGQCIVDLAKHYFGDHTDSHIMPITVSDAVFSDIVLSSEFKKRNILNLNQCPAVAITAPSAEYIINESLASSYINDIHYMLTKFSPDQLVEIKNIVEARFGHA